MEIKNSTSHKLLKIKGNVLQNLEENIQDGIGTNQGKFEKMQLLQILVSIIYYSKINKSINCLFQQSENGASKRDCKNMSIRLIGRYRKSPQIMCQRKEWHKGTFNGGCLIYSFLVIYNLCVIYFWTKMLWKMMEIHKIN